MSALEPLLGGIVLILLFVVAALVADNLALRRRVSVADDGWSAYLKETRERESDRRAAEKQRADLEGRLSVSRAALVTSDEGWRDDRRDLALAVEIVKNAVAAGKAGELFVTEAGKIDRRLQTIYKIDSRLWGGPEITYEFGQFETQALRLITGGESSTDRATRLALENRAITEKLATERQKSAHLRRLLKSTLAHYALHVRVGFVPKQVDRDDRKFDIIESIENGNTIIKLRDRKLPADKAPQPL